MKKRSIVKLATAIHSPFDTRIFHKEAKSLNQAGYEVSIIVPHDKRETRDQIKIIPVRKPKNGIEQLIITPLLVFINALKQSRKAIYHVHDSELLLICIFLRLTGRRVVYDAHEDTPLQISYQHWIPRLLKKPYAQYYKLLEYVSGRMFNAIIVAEPIIARYFPKKKVVLIRNFPLLSSFQGHKYIPYESREKRLIYVGLMSVPRGAREMVKAANIASNKVNFNFVIGGKFSPKSLQQEILQNSKNVKYIGWLSMSQLVDEMLLSRVGIIIPHPNDRYTTNYPVKMFEYMAAGLPVIASREGISAEFIKESEGGMLIDPLDENEAARAILYLLDNEGIAKQMGEKGKKMVYKKYNWEVESTKLLALYDQLFT